MAFREKRKGEKETAIGFLPYLPGLDWTHIPSDTGRCSNQLGCVARATIFKCTPQWHRAHSHRCATITPIHLQNFFIFLNETVYPLNNNSCSPSTGSPWPPPSYCLILWIWLLQLPHGNRIRQFLSFCVWLGSVSIMSSRFIPVVACVRIFFLRVKAIPLYVDTTCVNLPICCFCVYTQKWNCWIVW